ncbi:hypothetical protein COY87_03750 [Candidatus Roizmanbacteria bacterium CG_4_10_14_0_8_um_filter_33_9]|uniref:Uncharacterized protein n=1 Tax=Candidatus Roizmanbacteria bacterium CG_4_10_14_0_8_um_filter_33_9 TaxID=1974826 RepID=A0A2M7QHW5_9BACT|nr:MAG: hypothetical protein COY87_03750 [Candidatus Roizmanbacteria bacterium CG_4_10_14_0_8_um_filter_33_9]
MQCNEAPASTQQPIEQKKEPQFKHKLYWILGSHSTSVEGYNQQGFWPKEVVTQVEQTRPHQIVTDSLKRNVVATDIKGITPHTNPGNAYPERENLYLVGADFEVELINKFGETKWQVTPIWKQILEDDDYFKTLIDHPNANRSKLFSDALINAYSIEGGLLLPVLTLLSASGISATESAIKHTPFSLSRRMFIKAATGVALTAAVEYARWQGSQSLFNLMATNTNPDRNQLFAKAMQLVKPKIFQSTYLDLRNIKLGLTAYANAKRLQQNTPVTGEFVTAIVFGNAHSLGTDPTMKEEVLLSQLRNHLVQLHTNLPTLTAFGGNIQTVKQKLLSLFSDYVVYEIPQDQQGENIGFQATFHQNEKVNQMIDEIFI